MKNKIKLSISVDVETVDIIHKLMRSRNFRNRSHAFEYAIHKLNEVKE
jgi:hypothetical protein